VFLIVSLISGCDKLTDIVRPVAPQSLNATSLAPKSPKVLAPEPSNTPVPTSSPKETAPVLPDSAVSSSWFSWYGYVPTINLVDNPVAYWALNAVVYAVIAVGCAVVYRLVRPLEGEYIQDYYISGEDIDVLFEEVDSQGYRLCDVAQEDTISYTWYLFKKVTSRGFYQDRKTKKELKGIPILMNNNVKAYDNEFECSHLYKPNPAPSNIEE
jgi:hypothetical protein